MCIGGARKSYREVEDEENLVLGHKLCFDFKWPTKSVEAQLGNTHSTSLFLDPIQFDVLLLCAGVPPPYPTPSASSDPMATNKGANGVLSVWLGAYPIWI